MSIFVSHTRDKGLESCPSKELSWACSSVAEHLLDLHEALDSIPCAVIKQNKIRWSHKSKTRHSLIRLWEPSAHSQGTAHRWFWSDGNALGITQHEGSEHSGHKERASTPWNDCDKKTENTSLGKETGKLEGLGAADVSVRCGGYCRK